MIPGQPPPSRSGLLQAVAFLSVLGKGAAPSPSSLKWFPVVGWALGALLGASWWGLERVLPSFAASAVVVGEDLALTGMLHLDGLADSADGLLAQLPPERRLAVMSEPQVGAFGVVSVAIALLLRVAALSGAATGAVWQAVLLLGAVWATARSMMVLAMATIPYARQHGMATAFVSGRPAEPLAQRATVPTVATLSAVVFGLAGGAFAIASSRHLSEGAVILAGVLSASLVLFLASRRIGGYTGDVLGAAGVVAETVGLLVAAGKW